MARTHSGEAARVKRIAVDLTPLAPGGENGGIKLLAIDLVRLVSAHRPDCEFVLLTAERSHAELAALDAANVRRMCVSHSEAAPSPSLRRAFAARQLLRKLLPASTVDRIGALYGRLHRMPAESPLLRRLEADLLFCPFTGIFFYDPSVPVVCVVADLQSLYYPQFFTAQERLERERNFRHVCRVASRIVCISEYTRGTLIDQTGLARERTAVIHIAARAGLARTERASPITARYLLYPANFWRHKNHELLLTAFGMYRAAHPQSDLKLALTGAPSPRRDELAEAVCRMGLAQHVIFPGYLGEADYAALLAGAAGLIFPSLFEGFGMPVLEAMSAGVPVLCGNLTSLPEIAAAAALQFDPRRPSEIAAAIERFETDAVLRAELIERGCRRAAEFLQPAAMAARYWDVFEEAVRAPAERPAGVYGVFPDGWTGPRMTVVFGSGATPRRLTLTLYAPEGLPSAVSIRVADQVHRIARGRRATIALDLPGEAGVMEFECAPAFQPGGQDPRRLGCRLESAAIEGAQLPREAHAA